VLLDRISSALRKGTTEEGVFVKIEPFRRTCELLAVLPSDVPPPEIVVESERSVLTVTVDDTSNLGFAALFGRDPLHGKIDFAGTLPETLAYLIKRVFTDHRHRQFLR
jgi:hypothetical protein